MKDKVKVNKFKVRNFSWFSADCFNTERSQVDWNAIVETKCYDVNDLFSSFYNKFISLSTSTHLSRQFQIVKQNITALQTMDNSMLSHLH